MIIDENLPVSHGATLMPGQSRAARTQACARAGRKRAVWALGKRADRRVPGGPSCARKPRAAGVHIFQTAQVPALLHYSQPFPPMLVTQDRVAAPDRALDAAIARFCGMDDNGADRVPEGAFSAAAAAPPVALLATASLRSRAWHSGLALDGR
jgi:hypothetical protein